MRTWVGFIRKSIGNLSKSVRSDFDDSFKKQRKFRAQRRRRTHFCLRKLWRYPWLFSSCWPRDGYCSKAALFRYLIIGWNFCIRFQLLHFRCRFYIDSVSIFIRCQCNLEFRNLRRKATVLVQQSRIKCLFSSRTSLRWLLLLEWHNLTLTLENFRTQVRYQHPWDFLAANTAEVFETGDVNFWSKCWTKL